MRVDQPARPGIRASAGHPSRIADQPSPHRGYDGAARGQSDQILADENRVFHQPPTLGEHTKHILNSLLDIGDDEISRLEKDKIIYCG
jgi:crotonobetainyl-CoA:carnitine CoA-transferase CaiB-like acyl-CoA transferase